MSAPLWRLVLFPNEAVWYGPEDGTYGTEKPVRREYELLKAKGLKGRLEHRESPGDPWKEQSGKSESYPLFGEQG